jgi:hypothetical protein
MCFDTSSSSCKPALGLEEAREEKQLCVWVPTPAADSKTQHTLLIHKFEELLAAKTKLRALKEECNRQRKILKRKQIEYRVLRKFSAATLKWSKKEAEERRLCFEFGLDWPEDDAHISLTAEDRTESASCYGTECVQ